MATTLTAILLEKTANVFLPGHKNQGQTLRLKPILTGASSWR